MQSEDQKEVGGPDEEGDSVRVRILRGAVQAFSSNGYAGTSVESILAPAGVSRRTFYKHFRNKEEVFRTLFERSVQHLAHAVRRAIEHPEQGPIERIVRAAEAYVAVHAKGGQLARVMLLEQRNPSSPIAEQRDEARALFVELIRDSARRSGMADPDPLLVAGVLAGINRICLQMTEPGAGAADVERAKAAVLRILVALDDRSDPSRWTDRLSAALNS